MGLTPQAWGGRHHVTGSSPAAGPGCSAPVGSRVVIEVISPGPLTTIQDLGRPGFAHLGVPPSGAADRPALRLANRLAGNPDGAAALESTLSGPKLRIHGHAVVALAGAEVRARAGGRELPMRTPVGVGDDQLLSIGRARDGMRTYIAFSGGIAAPLTLGSAATDLLSGLGPPPLRAGDLLALGSASAHANASAHTGRTLSLEPADSTMRLEVALGPRADWFTATALWQLTHAPFTVTPDSNRIGVRLAGPRLDRARDGELRSEGLVTGAVQVPPGGQPILLLADHPTTGGYPVIATVLTRSLPLAAQLRPGQRLRFTVPAPPPRPTAAARS